jgi:hypothetical protein
MPVYVTFKKFPSARTGNCLFQYLTCKLFTLLQGHTYIPYETFNESDFETITDTNFESAVNDPAYADKHIVCEGYFQKSRIFISSRIQLVALLKRSNDIWYENNTECRIQDFLNSKHGVDISERDIVISLRLDDFLQLPCPTSDIIPPSFYTNYLETQFFERLFIICDKIRHPWEVKYLEYFKKWNPTLIQGDLLNDFAVMRTAQHLMHSNSTLCWVASFLGGNKRRMIPRTGFYKGQDLSTIENSDKLLHVKPLLHSEVYALDVEKTLHNYLPIPYAIPDEFIESCVSNKSVEMSCTIPGAAYTFETGMEREYLEKYRQARFALTQRKGGWDCLRHYEILASSCIPLFQNLDSLPSTTMISFPRELLKVAYSELLPYNESKASIYQKWSEKLLAYTRENNGTMALAKYFLTKFPSNTRRILVFQCNNGSNYTREMLIIGLQRLLGNSVVTYPHISYLHTDNTIDKTTLHGLGFFYTDRLPAVDKIYDESEILQSIQNKEWDLIVYGKVGPDEHGNLPHEATEGSLEGLPFWNIVSANYNKSQIAFLYGGDGFSNLTKDNKYRQHLERHSQYGKCFVRELCTQPVLERQYRIGVIIPSFVRDLHLLKRCLSSIESQTRKPDVVAISISNSQISDINTDKYSFPIRWIITDRTQNAAMNRNMAAKLLVCDCDYVTFLDSDDEMLPHRIEFIMRAFTECLADFVVHNFVTVKSNEDKPHAQITDYVCIDALVENPDPYGGVILRRDIALPYAEITNGHVSVRASLLSKFSFPEGESYRLYQDSYFNKQLIKAGHKGVYVYTQLSNYHCYR